MLIPYRVKNPAKRFPVATLCIMSVNVLVYAFTTDYLLAIREDIVEAYGFAFGASPFVNFFASAFLHGDILHLVGNMLFLWVFGPPVESRLRIPRYLLLYFATGLVGDMAQALLDIAISGHAQLTIGASGCIMGIVGAYWFLYPWSTVCVFYWIGWFWHGVWEVAAIWIAAIYMLMDLAEGVLYGAVGVSGGVANFAHLGGAIAGVILCLAFRVKRDTEAMSDAKAIQADMKSLSMMPLHALRTMAEQDPGNPELIRAMLGPAGRLDQEHVVDEAMRAAGTALIEKDPALVADYLVKLRRHTDTYRPKHLLRLAGLLQSMGSHQQAWEVYRLIAERYPAEPDTEMALYRMADLCWETYKDAERARACLGEMAKRFPNGAMAHFGETLMDKLPG